LLCLDVVLNEWELMIDGGGSAAENAKRLAKYYTFAIDGDTKIRRLTAEYITHKKAWQLTYVRLETGSKQQRFFAEAAVLPALGGKGGENGKGGKAKRESEQWARRDVPQGDAMLYHDCPWRRSGPAETGVATPPQRTLDDVVRSLGKWCNGLTEHMPELLSRDLKTRYLLHASMTRLADTTFEACCLLAKSIDDDETSSAEKAAAAEASAALAATAAKAAVIPVFLAATGATATATEQREGKQLQIEGRDTPSSTTRQHAEGGQSSSSRQQTEDEVQAKKEHEKKALFLLRARNELEKAYKGHKERQETEKNKEKDGKRGERRKVDQAAPAHEVEAVRDIAADHEEPVRRKRLRLVPRDGHEYELQRPRRP
jgi:hypothetical protein